MPPALPRPSPAPPACPELPELDRAAVWEAELTPLNEDRNDPLPEATLDARDICPWPAPVRPTARETLPLPLRENGLP